MRFKENLNMKGMIIAVPPQFEKAALKNVTNLRENLGFSYPIEIWEAGEEMTPEGRENLAAVPDVVLRNVSEFDRHIKFWRGYQIKGFICKYTAFDDFILCDADVKIQMNPEIIWNSPEYQVFGNYFFRDCEQWKFSDLRNEALQIPISKLLDMAHKVHEPRQFLSEFLAYINNRYRRVKYYKNRRKWVHKLLPVKSQYFPIEWDHIYEKEIPAEPVAGAHMESGVVYIDKKRHPKQIDIIFELNKNYRETFNVIWGDTDTYWMAFCMTDEPFYMNDTYPEIIEHRLHQYYKNEVFYIQKEDFSF
jgi:hypothetical protein